MGIFKKETTPATAVQVEIDGLPVDVDAERWEAEPKVVEAEVREARAGLRLPVDPNEHYFDYDELVGDDSDVVGN